jgi:hypothetical protein
VIFPLFLITVGVTCTHALETPPNNRAKSHTANLIEIIFEINENYIITLKENSHQINQIKTKREMMVDF